MYAMNGRTEVYKAKKYTAAPIGELWGISEDGKPAFGPTYRVKADAEAFVTRLNRQEACEPAFGRD